MTNKIFSSMFGSLAFAFLLAGGAYGDTFEYLTYTPPPSPGWTKQALPEGIAYRRVSGIGLIAFYASHPATGTPAEEFARVWRARVEPMLPGSAPQPHVQSDGGGYMVAMGSQRVDAQGTITTLVLVAITGKGRTISLLTMSAGEDVFREVTTFLDSISVGPQGAASSSAPGAAPNPAGGGGVIEVDFEVPAGYVSKRDGGMILLVPTAFTEKTACAYGFSPSRPSSGDLEADARAALLEPHPGWKPKSENYNAMRGTAGEGWKYFWFKTTIESFQAGGYQVVNAMAMAFEAGPGRAGILWGVGDMSRCQLDDPAFVGLFHSLRPRGWTSDGGRALAAELKGTWRYTNQYGIRQYKFMDGGRYEFGRGTTTTMGMLETTTSGVTDGSYKLSGSELTLKEDGGGGASKFHVRVYERYAAKGWHRMLSFYSDGAKQSSDVEYERVRN